ncbi:MAG: mandelate racemase/muconate lactonizing enzyme family protein [Geminicoccaceae bacterium]
MRIAAIDISHHGLDLDPPFPAAWDPTPRQRFQISVVRLRTEDGTVGVGAGDPMPGFAGNEQLFVGQDLFAVDRHHRLIDNLSFHHGRCWPLDIALWDAIGKARKQPVWRLLGAAQTKVPVYASTGVRRTAEASVEQALRITDMGFKALKLRLDPSCWPEELERIGRVIEAVRPRDVEVMVDANQAWRMPWDHRPLWSHADARVVAQALDEMGAYWLEEPLHRGDVAALATLRREAGGLRIAGGELLREMHDVQRYIDEQAVDVLQADVAMVGGLTGLNRLGRLARARAIEVSPHSWGDGIVLAANLQLVGAIGGCHYLEYPFDPPEWTPERRDFALRHPILPDADGTLAMPEAPGLGIELDEDRLAATRIA